MHCVFGERERANIAETSRTVSQYDTIIFLRVCVIRVVFSEPLFMMMMMMMIRIREIACEGILAQSTTLFGRWIAGYWPVSGFGLILEA